MRRRGLSNDDGSLELLLDAMCNAFGGVMFIAILVIVIAREQPTEADPQTAAADYQHVVNELKRQIERLDLELNALYERRQEREKLLEKYEDQPNGELVPTYLALETERTQLNNKLERTLEQHEFQQERTAEYIQKQIEIEKRIAELEQQNQQLQQSLETSTDHLEQMRVILNEPIRSRQTLDVNFATLRTSGGLRPFFIIVEAGRVYRISSYHQSPTAAPQWSDDVTYSFQKSKSLYTFTPRPGKAFVIETATKSALKRYFSPVAQNQYFVGALVKNDSFEEWLSLKKTLEEDGFRYDWIPVADSEKYEITVVPFRVDYESY